MASAGASGESPLGLLVNSDGTSCAGLPVTLLGDKKQGFCLRNVTADGCDGLPNEAEASLSEAFRTNKHRTSLKAEWQDDEHMGDDLPRIICSLLPEKKEKPSKITDAEASLNHQGVKGGEDAGRSRASQLPQVRAEPSAPRCEVSRADFFLSCALGGCVATPAADGTLVLCHLTFH
ncbi:hypothetical protein CB1_000610014 [Camelus ferus]|nr:hypothetical protein CB1_000610014 [Camelus ferus]